MAQARLALVVAGGMGTRMGSTLPKQFLPLLGKPVLWHTLQVFTQLPELSRLVLVLPETEIERWNQLRQEFPLELNYIVTSGGQTRTQSVINGLALLPDQGVVAIHDGARPLVTPELIRQSWETAEKTGAAVCAVPLKDSIREIREPAVSVARNRENFRLVQTPQTFEINRLKAAYAKTAGESFTDDAAVWEATGENLSLIMGSYENLKITTPEDLHIATFLLNSR